MEFSTKFDPNETAYHIDSEQLVKIKEVIYRFDDSNIYYRVKNDIVEGKIKEDSLRKVTIASEDSRFCDNCLHFDKYGEEYWDGHIAELFQCNKYENYPTTIIRLSDPFPVAVRSEECIEQGGYVKFDPTEGNNKSQDSLSSQANLDSLLLHYRLLGVEVNENKDDYSQIDFNELNLSGMSDSVDFSGVIHELKVYDKDLSDSYDAELNKETNLTFEPEFNIGEAVYPKRPNARQEHRVYTIDRIRVDIVEGSSEIRYHAVSRHSNPNKERSLLMRGEDLEPEHMQAGETLLDYFERHPNYFNPWSISNREKK